MKKSASKKQNDSVGATSKRKSKFRHDSPKFPAGNNLLEDIYSPPLVQTKLTLSRPGDKFEEEADRLAEEVMNMPELPVAKSAGNTGRQLPGLQIQKITAADRQNMQMPLESETEKEDDKVAEETSLQAEPQLLLIQKHQQAAEKNENEQAEKEEEEEEVNLQTKKNSAHTPDIPPGIEERIKSRSGNGLPLPEQTRAFFEPRFGYDFRNIRIHNDSLAAEISRSLNAQAFTNGRDIFFGAGRFQPDSTDGKKLLAHELVHVAQQLPPRVINAQRYLETKEPLHGDALSMGNAVAQDFEREEKTYGIQPIVNQYNAPMLSRRILGGEKLENGVEKKNTPQKNKADAAKLLINLDADPSDNSGRTKALLRRMEPSNREAVLAELKTVMTPEKQKNFERIVSRAETDKNETKGAKLPELPAPSDIQSDDAKDVGANKEKFPTNEEMLAEAMGNIQHQVEESFQPETSEKVKELDIKPVEEVTGELPAEAVEQVIQPLDEAAMDDAIEADLDKLEFSEEDIKDEDSPEEEGEKDKPEEIPAQESEELPEAGEEKEAISPRAVLEELASSRVTFKPREQERAGDPGTVKVAQDKRAFIETLATNFLAQLVAQALALLTRGDSAQPRITTSSEAAKAGVDNATSENRSAVVGKITAKTEEIQQTAEAGQAHVNKQHRTTVAKIKKQQKSTRKKIVEAHKTTIQKTNDKEITQIKKIEKGYKDSDRDYRKSGKDVGEEARSRGKEREKNYLSRLNGEDSFWNNKVHDKRLKARAKTAVKVSSEYDKGLQKSANEQADKALEGKPKDIDQLKKTIEESRKVVDKQQQTSTAAVNTSSDQAQEKANKTKAKMAQAIEDGQETTLSSLQQQQEVQTGRLETYNEQQTAAIDRDSQSAIQLLQMATSQAAIPAIESLQAFIREARSIETPEENVLPQALSEAQGGFETQLGEVSQQLEQGISLTQTTLAEGAQQVTDSVKLLGSSAIEQADASVIPVIEGIQSVQEGATVSGRKLRKVHSKFTDESKEKTLTGFKKVTEGIDKLNETYEKNVKKSTETSKKQLKEGLQNFKDDKLDSDINKYGDEAAKQIQPWWKKLVKFLVVIAVIVVVFAVAGPIAVAAVGKFAAALGAGKAAAAVIGTIVGGAIVGAAANVSGTIVGNVMDGRNALEGWKNAALAGAITGPFALGGAAVSNALLQGVKSTIGRIGLGFAIEAPFDVVGGVLANLATGVSLGEGILAGLAMGLGFRLGGNVLGKIKSSKAAKTAKGEIEEPAIPAKEAKAKGAEAESKGTGKAEAEEPTTLPKEAEAKKNAEATKTGEREIEEPAIPAKEAKAKGTEAKSKGTGKAEAEEPTTPPKEVEAKKDAEATKTGEREIEEPAIPTKEAKAKGTEAESAGTAKAGKAEVEEPTTPPKEVEAKKDAEATKTGEREIEEPAIPAKEAKEKGTEAESAGTAKAGKAEVEEPTTPPKEVEAKKDAEATKTGEREIEEPAIPAKEAKEKGTEAEEPTKKTSEQQKTPLAVEEDPTRIIRQDNDFKAIENRKGTPKSHIDESGSLRPANPDGSASVLEHVYGSIPAKADSPYTSFLTERGGKAAKPFGNFEVELDLPRLQADIGAGVLKNVEVLPPPKVSGVIKADIENIAAKTKVNVDINAAIARGPQGISDYVESLRISSGNKRKLGRRLLAYFNTSRDGEYLIKGTIPRTYFTSPTPSKSNGI